MVDPRDHDDEEKRWRERKGVGYWAVPIAAIVVIVVLMFMALLVRAIAAPMGYCTLYSREFVRIIIAGAPDTDVDLRTATEDLIAFMRLQAYTQCLNRDEEPPLPDIPEASDAHWVRAARSPIVATLGTVPATDAPVEPAEPGDWTARCKAEYRTFDEADGTVIRRNSAGKRVQCPLPK